MKLAIQWSLQQKWEEECILKESECSRVPGSAWAGLRIELQLPQNSCLASAASVRRQEYQPDFWCLSLDWKVERKPEEWKQLMEKSDSRGKVLMEVMEKKMWVQGILFKVKFSQLMLKRWWKVAWLKTQESGTN